MKILGFESSCDETGVALVCSSRGLIGQALHSQIDLHRDYGGVVPELASRDHIRRLIPLMHAALAQAACSLGDIDAIAYTAGPGLAGALLTGAAFAKSLAFALGKPAWPVHHLEGHLLSPLLAQPAPQFPFVALLVSGGHTQLMDVRGVGDYTLLGETVDDAAGEAFDKTAKLLGLPYPGGPALAALAAEGQADAFHLPRPMLRSTDLDFSFSGLKTAVLTQVSKLTEGQGHAALDDKTRKNLAASTQTAIVEVLVEKSLRAIELTGRERLVVAGGVGANRLLRERLSHALEARGHQAFYPPVALCTDNGAMIAWAALLRHQAGLSLVQSDPLAIEVRARWPLEELTTVTRPTGSKT